MHIIIHKMYMTINEHVILPAIELREVLMLFIKKINLYDENKTKELQYICAICADEILLNKDWHGKNVWSQYLLEEALFRTRQAGAELFEKIEKILITKMPRDFAILYLIAICIGVRGIMSEKDIGIYKQRLIDLISGTNGYDKSTNLTVARERPITYLTKRFSGFKLFGIFVIAYTSVTGIAWYMSTMKLQYIASNITKGNFFA